MEAGENPARSRHCKEGAMSRMPLYHVMVREGGQSAEFRVRRHA